MADMKRFTMTTRRRRSTPSEITTTSLTLHRVDRGGKTATLTGKFSSEGNRLLDGVMTWDDGRRVPFNLAWGEAISGVVRPKGQAR